MEETMSAVVWEGARSGYAAGAPGPVRVDGPGRPRLVLVPTGDAVRDPEGGLRLTRRGRMVLAGLFVALAVALGGFVLQSPSTPAPATHTVTVRPGQSLSQIAATELPGLSPAQGMTAIRVANELNTTTITPGQSLVIPQT
jgi:hypothetical protein